MNAEFNPAADGLTPHQSLILQGFLQACTFRPENPGQVSVLDQSVASMRENITEGFGLELGDKQEFYAVMAGLSAATSKMVALINMGLSPELASQVLRTSLAGLYPNPGDTNQ